MDFDPDFPACEDFEFWLRIVPDHHVGFIPKPYLVRYGGHPDQLSMRYPAQDRFRIRAIALLLERNNLDPARRAQALEAFEEKLGIYESGCRKRGNTEGLAWCGAVRTAALELRVALAPYPANLIGRLPSGPRLFFWSAAWTVDMGKKYFSFFSSMFCCRSPASC